MTINYTTLLGLAQPVTGTEANTWGTVVNDSVTALVEDSIAGSATAAVTSGDWTLTTTGAGAANQARAAILIPTGAPGVSRNIIAPSASKAYIVDNQSDGAVVLKGAATTGATIAAGTAALVAWNGTDFVLVSQALANATGVLPVAKGGTGITSFGTGVATALGQNVTGSGGMALSTSPTLTTPNLGTPSAATLTNATGLPIVVGTTGTLSVVRGGTGVTTSTGTGSVVLSTSPTLTTPNLGTPSAATLTNATGLPIVAGTTGTLAVNRGGTNQTSYTDGQLLIGNTAGNTLAKATLTAGSGVSITNGAGSVTIAATGSGGTVTSVGGTGTVNGISLSGTVTSSGNLTLGGALTGVNLTTQVTGTLPVANGGTGVTSSTGTGSSVLSTSPTLVTPVLGTPTSGNATNLVGLPLTTGVTGTLPVANGGTGLTSAGTSGNVLTSNGTGFVSAAPAPSAGTLEAVASGTLSDGSTVIINADGTVSVVATVGVDPSFGTAEVFESASTNFTSATFDSSLNKVVIAYRDSDNSGYGTAVVGTVSGTSISFGTAVVFESASSLYMSATFDSNLNKVVIAYHDAANLQYGTARVGTVSGTSISFGTTVVFESARSNFMSATFDSSLNKVVIAYQDNDNSGFGTAIVGTVSGTSISFGTAVVFESADSFAFSATFDSNLNKVVIAYTDQGNSFYGTAVVGTVSGTSISFGTAVVFESASSDVISATFDSNSNKVVIAYRDVGNSNYGTAIVGTVSGTSISFGTAVVFESASSGSISATFDSNSNKVVIAYTDNGNSSYGTAVVGTVSGTSISFGTAAVFESASSGSMSTTFDSVANKVVIAYRDSNNSGYGTSVTMQNSASSLTAENYIGISNGAYSDTSTATIQIVGSVDDAQTGLTAGQAYYVQGDGSLATTAADPEVFAGTAVSATKLIVKG